jgi:tetratricopeptide (TPR) repeat protein
VRYNLALALQGLGKTREAETALTSAQQIDPHDPEVAYALTLFYLQANDWPRALAAAEKLSVIMPDNGDVKGLIEDIRRRANAQ